LSLIKTLWFIVDKIINYFTSLLLILVIGTPFKFLILI